MAMSNRPNLFDRPPSLAELPKDQQALLAAWFLLALAAPLSRHEQIPDRLYWRAIGELAHTIRIRTPCKKKATVQTALSNRQRKPRIRR